MSPLPVRVEMKASDLPSGEKSGRDSVAGCATSSRADPPAAGALQMSPPETKTTLFASGESDGSNMAGWAWRAVAKRQAVKNMRIMRPHCTSDVVEFVDGLRTGNGFSARSPMALVERRDGNDEEADAVGARPP